LAQDRALARLILSGCVAPLAIAGAAAVKIDKFTFTRDRRVLVSATNASPRVADRRAFARMEAAMFNPIQVVIDAFVEHLQEQYEPPLIVRRSTSEQDPSGRGAVRSGVQDER